MNRRVLPSSRRDLGETYCLPAPVDPVSPTFEAGRLRSAFSFRLLSKDQSKDFLSENQTFHEILWNLKILKKSEISQISRNFVSLWSMCLKLHEIQTNPLRFGWKTLAEDNFSSLKFDQNRSNYTEIFEIQRWCKGIENNKHRESTLRIV